MDFEFDSFVTTFSNPLGDFEVLAESMVTAGIGNVGVSVGGTLEVGVNADPIVVGDNAAPIEVGSCSSSGVLGEVGPGALTKGE